MAELTIEQKRAIALAEAARRRAEAEAERQRMTHAAKPEKPPMSVAEARDAMVYKEKPIASAAASWLTGIPFAGEWIDNAAGAVLGKDTAGAMRAGARGYERENPGQAALGQFGTGVAASLPAAVLAPEALTALAGKSLLAQTARGVPALALGGGLEGAISAAGDEDASRPDLAARTAIGAGTGAGLGFLAPLVNRGVKNTAEAANAYLARRGVERVGASPPAGQALREAIGADGLDNIRADLRGAGDDAMLADGGPALSGLLDVAIQNSGGGARVAREAVESRASDTRKKLTEALNQHLGIPGQSNSRDLVVYGDRVSPIARMYTKAYSQPIDYSSPAGAEIERLIKNNVPQEVIDRANKLLRMDPDFDGVPQIMAKVDEAGNVTYEELPGVAQIDLITRALRDVAERGDGMGALGGNTNEGRVYGNLAKRIRDQLKAAVPDWETAVNRAGDEIGKLKARDLGTQALSTSISRREFRDRVMQMGDAEREKVKEGLREAIDDRLARVKKVLSDPNRDSRQAYAGTQMLTTEDAEDKIRLLLGKEADTLMKSISEAERALQLKARVVDNSKTFARMNIAARIDDTLQPGPVGRAMEGKPVDASQEVIQAITGRTSEAKRAEREVVFADIAKALTDRRGRASEKLAEDLVSILNKKELSDEASAALARALTGGGAALGYQYGKTSLAPRPR